MDNKKSSVIRKLVITAALGSLTIFLGITRLGLIPWVSGVSITIMHIPAIIGAILEGSFVGAGIGSSRRVWQGKAACRPDLHRLP